MSNFYVKLGNREIGFKVSHGGGQAVVSVLDAPGGEGETMAVDFAAVHSNPQTGEGLYSLIVNGKSYQLYLTPGKPTSIVAVSRHRVELQVLSEREWRLEKIAPKEAVHSGKTTVRTPMPGLVKGVLVEPGAQVKIGSRLLVLEAMKMENDIVSPRDGQVSAVHVKEGEIVEGGKALVDVE